MLNEHGKKSKKSILLRERNWDIARNALNILTYGSKIIFSYHLCFQMMNARDKIAIARNAGVEITPYMISSLVFSNFLRAFYGAGGLLINVNYANNGVLVRTLDKLNNYFHNERAKNKKSAVFSLFKILAVTQILYGATYYLWSAADKYGPGTPSHKAIQWVWAIFFSVNLQVLHKDIIRTAMRSFFIQSETPFCLVRVENVSYKVQNPNFKGRKFTAEELNENDIATKESIKSVYGDKKGTQMWNLIQEKIQEGKFKSVESNNGLIDNDFNKKSWVVRGGVGLLLSGFSLGSGVLLGAVLENTQSLSNLGIRSYLLAFQDCTSLYVGLWPFIQPMIVQKFIKLFFAPCIMSEDGKITTKQMLRLLATSVISINVTFGFYGFYRLIYDKVLYFSVYPYPDIHFINQNSNNTIVTGSVLTDALNGSSNEFIANGALGAAILCECFSFFNILDTWMNGLEFFKTSLKRKSAVCQIILLGLAAVVVSGVPLDHIASQYFFAAACGAMVAMSSKFEYTIYKKNKAQKLELEKRRIEPDYIDEIYNEVKASEASNVNDTDNERTLMIRESIDNTDKHPQNSQAPWDGTRMTDDDSKSLFRSKSNLHLNQSSDSLNMEMISMIKIKKKDLDCVV